MKTSRKITVLAGLVAALALIATLGGIVLQEAGDPVAFTTARGEQVELLGTGLYQYDTVFAGANYRAQDIVTLALGVPLLLGALVIYTRGSLRGGLFLAAMLGFFSYVYASMALAAAFNDFFLIYVAIMSASIFGLILLILSIGQEDVGAQMGSELPYKAGAIFMVASGVVTLVVWLIPLLAEQFQGLAPGLLDHNTTMVTHALDLAFITPGAFVCGAMLTKRRPLGFVLSMPLLGTIVMLLPLIIGGTISQIEAGIDFTPAEIIGPIAGFALLGISGTVLLIAVLRRVQPRPGRKRTDSDAERSLATT